MTNRLKQLRLDAGLSVEELAYDAGVDPSYIRYLQRGDRLPTLNTAYRIAGALGVNVNQIWPAVGRTSVA